MESSIVVYRGRGRGKGSLRGNRDRSNSTAQSIYENNFKDLQQEFYEFMLAKNIKEREESLNTNDEILAGINHQQSPMLIDTAKFKEFEQTMEKFNNNMGLFRVIADVTILTSSFY